MTETNQDRKVSMYAEAYGGPIQTPEFDKLKWKKFPVLNGQGYVCLVDRMGDETAIVQAARVSYGEGTKLISDDVTLIRYLMRHRHTTPLEMVVLKILVFVPMDAWRQWIRHRTASVNEYSTRYSEAIDQRQETDPGEWRLQSTTNKQGSSGYLEEWPEGTVVKAEYDGDHFFSHWRIFTGGEEFEADLAQDAEGFKPGDFLSEREKAFHAEAQKIYEERLSLGVAREQARKDLPLSTFTQAYWKIDLHNLLHFLSLRMDSHAQKEIREYATTIGEQIVKPLYPSVWQAFLDYRMNALTLTGPEIELLTKINDSQMNSFLTTGANQIEERIPNKRERGEFYEKMKKLGYLVPSQT